MKRIFKHLTFTDRLRIEAMSKTGYSARDMADTLRVHISTIYRELKRGRYEHKNSDWTFETWYSPDIAESVYRENLAAKGPALKIGADHELAKYIEQRITEDRYSPAAALADIDRKKLNFKTTIRSVNTIYSYIDKEIFAGVTNKDLPEKGNRKRGYKKVKKTPARPPRGESIEKRPIEIKDREKFGHWEMDTVKGKNNTKKVLLVLTERMTRQEIEIPMKSCSERCVVQSLNKLERKYGAKFRLIFKTITVDNGSEFSDCKGMEKSCIRKNGKRTQMYYCHPYSSWERGSNENQNKLIRRWIPKGTPIENYSSKEIKRIQEWMNDYPRKLLGWKSSADLFNEIMKKNQMEAV